ncbi:MAG: protein DA1 [bacterium]
MTPPLSLLEKALTFIGRSIECALTGRTDYRFLSSEIASFDRVGDRLKAGIISREVRTFLSGKYGITVDYPVVLELFSGHDWDIHSIRYRMAGSIGRYHLNLMGENRLHCIYVLAGLGVPKFKSIFAHEYMHAFQRETGIFQHNRGLREGLARWIEYKVLLSEGAAREAGKLLRIQSWSRGRGLKRILRMEKEHTESGLVEYLKRSREK